MFLRILRWISLVGTAVTLGALTAHVLELPNKLGLDGPLWLAIQQNLYRGWGPFIGPFEVTAIVSTWVLVGLIRDNASSRRWTLLAAILLSTALGIFFGLNQPVNQAFAVWTPATLPSDWPSYRLRWEIGHAVGFLLVLIAFVALLRAQFSAIPAKRERGKEDIDRR